MVRKQSRRKPHTGRIVLLLIVALFLYHVIGGYAPFARAPELSAENAAAIERRAEEMCRDDDSSADRAMILETRAQALDERLRLISRAREEIIITTYDCRDSESTRDILCVALERADAGVRVRVLVDGLTGWANLKGSALLKAFNAHPNIEIRFYNPPYFFAPWRHMGRMHDKYVIVDGLAYILGGRNMFDHFLGAYPSPTGTYSNDREALVYSGARDGKGSLLQVKDYFETIWTCEDTRSLPNWGIPDSRRDAMLDDLRERRAALEADRPELFDSAVDYREMTLPTKGVWLVANPINIDAKQPVVFATLCALMARAKEDVIIHSPYAVLNGFMRDELAAIAEKAPVTLMINAVENGANVVASGDYLWHRGEVLATGMRVLEYAGGDSYHGKSLAIDGDISIIGSFNLDLRSAYVDTELMLVIRGEEVNALLRGHMEALHADCRQVIDKGAAETPEGLDIPPLSTGRALALRALGAVMQLFRNLV